MLRRTGVNPTNVAKPKTSQTGDQINQKYLPSGPRIIGTIEQSRKLSAATAPTTYRHHRTSKKYSTAGSSAAPATIISKLPAHVKSTLKSRTARNGSEYNATARACVRVVTLMMRRTSFHRWGLHRVKKAFKAHWEGLLHMDWSVDKQYFVSISNKRATLARRSRRNGVRALWMVRFPASFSLRLRLHQ